MGSLVDVKKWQIYDWVYISVRLAILGGYIFLQSLLSLQILALKFLIENQLTDVAIKVNWTLCRCVPIFGRHLQRIIPAILARISDTLLPALVKISTIVQICFQLHIVEMTLKDKKYVQIFVTAESDDLRLFDDRNKLMTTLLLANHRSVCDYMLINYLIQNSCSNRSPYVSKREVLRNFWKDEQLPFPNLKFITWGRIINFPHLLLLKNIMIKDENYFVSPAKIKEYLSNNGNEVIAIFPEVNIMTTELGMVQRKLNQDYPFVAKFYNVLYPRFKGFISVIKCFGHINNVKRKQHHRIISNAKIFFNNNIDKFIIKATSHSENTTEQNIAQAAMVLGMQNSADTIAMELDHKAEQEEKKTPGDTIKINQALYDLTIVYYKPKCVSVGRDHDHVNGQFKLHNGYRLEQVNPSLFEMLQPEKNCDNDNATYTTAKAPVVIMIHIKKHELEPLLPAKGRNLEKWLEHQWSEKDRLIDCIENGITIR